MKISWFNFGVSVSVGMTMFLVALPVLGPLSGQCAQLRQAGQSAFVPGLLGGLIMLACLIVAPAIVAVAIDMWEERKRQKESRKANVSQEDQTLPTFASEPVRPTRRDLP